MLGVILGGLTGDETNLERRDTGKNTLGSPSRKLAQVLLHLSSDNSTTLVGKLVLPLRTPFRAVLVKGSNVDERGDLTGDDSVNLSSHNKVNRLIFGRFSQVERFVAVAVSKKRILLLVGVVEGVGVSKLDLLGVVLQNSIDSEVLVNVGSLNCKVLSTVDVGFVSGVSRNIGGVLIDREDVKRTAISLVKENLVARLVDDDIPRVDRLGSTHKKRNNSISSKDLGSVLLSKLLDNGILRGGDVENSSVESLEVLVQAGLIKTLVVRRHITVSSNIRAGRNIEGEFLQLVELVGLNKLPLFGNLDRSVAVLLRLVVHPGVSLATRVVAGLVSGVATAHRGLLGGASVGTASAGVSVVSTALGLENGRLASLSVVNNRERSVVSILIVVKEGGGSISTVSVVRITVATLLLSLVVLGILHGLSPVGNLTKLVVLGVRGIGDVVELKRLRNSGGGTPGIGVAGERREFKDLIEGHC